MKKIPKKYTPILFSLYALGIMVAIMSSVLVGLNAGFNDEWFGRVVRSYFVTWPIAFVSLMVVRPIVMRLVAWTTE